jgi:DNA mismatch endonuclease, patch repair protein
MSDNLSPADRRRTMQAVKGKGTRIERRLFAMLAGMGFSGWKQNVAEITGKPDVAFLDLQVALFVDGCFWHGCPVCKRPLPVTNREYWERKIGRNVARAKSQNRELRRTGWTVMRIWEHEMKDTLKVKERILRTIGSKRSKDS